VGIKVIYYSYTTVIVMACVLCDTLVDAAKNGHVNCVKVYINAGDSIDGNGIEDTPLSWSVYKGHLECSKLLIEAGADINKPDRIKCTPLLWALRERNGGREFIDLLLDACVDLDTVNVDGNTALMRLAECHTIRHMKLLIDLGARMDITNLSGLTALDMCSGNVKCSDLIRTAIYDKTIAEMTTIVKPGITLLPFPIAGGHIVLYEMIASYALL